MSPPLPFHYRFTTSKRSLGKGIIFTGMSVILSMMEGGGSLYGITLSLAAWSHVLSRGSLSRGSLSPPPRQRSPVWWRAGGTHPTGMLSCLVGRDSPCRRLVRIYLVFYVPHIMTALWQFLQIRKLAMHHVLMGILFTDSNGETANTKTHCLIQIKETLLWIEKCSKLNNMQAKVHCNELSPLNSISS